MQLVEITHRSASLYVVRWCILMSFVNVCVLFVCSYLDHGMDNQTSTEIQDVCSITLDKSPCGVGIYFFFLINQV